MQKARRSSSIILVPLTDNALVNEINNAILNALRVEIRKNFPCSNINARMPTNRRRMPKSENFSSQSGIITNQQFALSSKLLINPSNVLLGCMLEGNN